MAMDPTFAKLATVVVVGSVAKALFTERPPVIHNHYNDPELTKDGMDIKIGEEV